MLQRLLFLLSYRLFFITLFLLSKILFLAIYAPEASPKDYFEVLYHGLSMDNTVGAYYAVLPTLGILLSLLIPIRWVQPLWRIVPALFILLTVVIVDSNLGLYTEWGFPIDSSVMLYLQSPKEAFASSPLWLNLLTLVVVLGIAHLIYHSLYRRYIVREILFYSGKRRYALLATLLLLGELVISARSSVGVSTMNVGRAYYSDNTLYNHAAVNPCFSLYSSLFDQRSVNEYDYFEESTFQQNRVNHFGGHPANSVERQLNSNRPNVVLIILEGFSANMSGSLDTLFNITPNLDKLAAEGLLFRNFFANSFRTDRGLTSILSATPPLPEASWMSYPKLLPKLPALPQTLRNEGYATEMIYGGDVDFTNMRLYFRAAGFEEVISQEEFDRSLRQSKWGVHDEHAFERLFQSIQQEKQTPFFKTLLTLSSHLPYEVPYAKLDDPCLNAHAYTDSCLGEFIDRFQQTPQWENTLLIILSDHSTNIPRRENYDPERYRIPMVWAGGALHRTGVVESYGSQLDLARTLLGQLEIEASPFVLSRDLFDTTQSHNGLFIFNRGFGVVNEAGSYSFDYDAEESLLKEGTHTATLDTIGRTLFQQLGRYHK